MTEALLEQYASLARRGFRVLAMHGLRELEFEDEAKRDKVVGMILDGKEMIVSHEGAVSIDGVRFTAPPAPSAPCSSSDSPAEAAGEAKAE